MKETDNFSTESVEELRKKLAFTSFSAAFFATLLAVSYGMTALLGPSTSASIRLPMGIAVIAITAQAIVHIGNGIRYSKNSQKPTTTATEGR